MPSRSWGTPSRTCVNPIEGLKAIALCLSLNKPSPFGSAQVEKPSDILTADRLIFPGVGAFGQAMRILTKKGMIGPLKEYLQVGSAKWCTAACMAAWTLDTCHALAMQGPPQSALPVNRVSVTGAI